MVHDISILPQLAAQANQSHENALKTASEALHFAKMAGDCLLKAKETLPHGEFSSWVICNCKFGKRTAQIYMRLSTHWQEIEATHPKTAELSIREALEYLAISSTTHQRRSAAAPLNENTLDVRKELSEEEAEDFRAIEATIATVRENARLAIDSLRAIRDGQLYRENCKTFVDWCLIEFQRTPDELVQSLASWLPYGLSGDLYGSKAYDIVDFNNEPLLNDFEFPFAIREGELFSVVAYVVGAYSDACDYTLIVTPPVVVIETDPSCLGHFRVAAAVNGQLRYLKKPICRRHIGSSLKHMELDPTKCDWMEPRALRAANNPLFDVVVEADERFWPWQYPADLCCT